MTKQKNILIDLNHYYGEQASDQSTWHGTGAHYGYGSYYNTGNYSPYYSKY